MHARAERRHNADAPIAKLIAHAFDDDGAVVRYLLGCNFLVCEVAKHVFCGELVEIVFARETCQRS